MDRLPRASILVVDDDPAILGLTHELLTSEGYHIVAAATHDEALVALSAVRFGLVLSDTGGAGDGARWTEPERIRAAAGDTPVVIFSAHDPDIFAGFHERGFAGVIAKPFDLEELLSRVRDLLRN